MNCTLQKLTVSLTAVLMLTVLSCTHPLARETVLLSGAWSFAVDSAGEGETQNWPVNGLPAALSRQVAVPHTWNTERALARYTGKAWYERQFTVPPERMMGLIRLQFDAVYHDAVVYINGQKAGEHLGSGYNRFFVDATPWVKAGENRLTVCADNSFSRSNIPFMRSYDWACDGGIYRNVHLVMTSREAVRNIHVTAVPRGKGGTAQIRINFADPATAVNASLLLKATVTEENQATSRVLYDDILHGNMKEGAFFSDLAFDSVNLWHFDSPNLYRLNIKVVAGGKEKDAYSTVFGFRTIGVANNRYVLNGEPMRLMGVEWMPGSTLEKGMAEDTADFAANLKLMKEANCIFTRFHWQQDEYVFDWCDRNGILIQEEIPSWGIWTILNDTLLPKCMQHLDEMIDDHYNHPSIMSWGIGNELLAHEPYIKTGLKKLYDHAKNLDPGRLATYVSNSLFFEMPSENMERSDATADFDMMMFNEYYSTWYNKSIDVIPSELDRIIGEYPGEPMTISEWGLCDPPMPGGDERRADEMTRQLSIYGSKPYIAGAIYFCLNNYRSQRGENYSAGYPIRDHGVTDGNLNQKKSYETLRNISSPVEIKEVMKDYDGLKIIIRGKTGIPSYIVRDYRLVAGSEEQIIRELKPGDEQTFTFHGDKKEFSIFRPTGFLVYHLVL